MKNLIPFAMIFISALSAISAQANNCPRSEKHFMCPGDAIVDSSGYKGTVAGVNPFQSTVAINYGSEYSNSINNIKGTFLRSGCIEGYCVGDSAVDQRGYRGTIDGVNPYLRKVAINYGSQYSDGIADLETVSLGLGCVMGSCTNDVVITPQGYRGKVVAVNRFNGTAAVNFGSEYSATNIAITNLASAEYCLKYGDSEREKAVFPDLSNAHYQSENFKFTLTR